MNALTQDILNALDPTIPLKDEIASLKQQLAAAKAAPVPSLHAAWDLVVQDLIEDTVATTYRHDGYSVRERVRELVAQDAEDTDNKLWHPDQAYTVSLTYIVKASVTVMAASSDAAHDMVSDDPPKLSLTNLKHFDDATLDDWDLTDIDVD